LLIDSFDESKLTGRWHGSLLWARRRTQISHPLIERQNTAMNQN
jgi:hypothetical protein